MSAGLSILFVIIFTISDFPPFISYFPEIARDDFILFLRFHAFIIFFAFILLAFLALVNLIMSFKIYRFKAFLPLIVTLSLPPLVLFISYPLESIWEKKIMMSWIRAKDLNAVVDLVNKHQLTLDNDNGALLPKNLRYLTVGTGNIWVNTYKIHKNETVIVFNRKLYFLDVDRYYYSSLDLPPTDNKNGLAVGDTCIYTQDKIKPHWYVIYETDLKNAPDCGHTN